MKKQYALHWAISAGLLLIVASINAVLQNHYSVDRLGQLVFLITMLMGLIFSSVFALWQVKLKHGTLNTLIAVSVLMVYLIMLQYLYHQLNIDWVAVSEHRYALTLFEKIIRSDLTYWAGFCIPFVLSVISGRQSRHMRT